MLEQRAVTALLELGKTSSFKVAAERLGLSQPTFTRLIQKVEREYGLTIFYCASAGVRPTLEGCAFWTCAGISWNSASNIKNEQ